MQKDDIFNDQCYHTLDLVSLFFFSQEIHCISLLVVLEIFLEFDVQRWLQKMGLSINLQME